MSETMTKPFSRFDEFTYWFTRKTPELFDVTNIKTGEVLCTIHETVGDGCPIEPTEESAKRFDLDPEVIDLFNDIARDFLMYKERPEYFVGSKWDEQHQGAVEFYEMCILGIALIRAKEKRANPDEFVPKAKKILDWIASTDFYTCPASTKYHDSYEGGLFYHTLRVLNKAIDLMHAEPFKSTVKNISSVVLAALVHDWCKIGLYDSYMRNVKDENGQWTQIKSYKYVEDRAICLGHGVSSMYLAMKFFNLSMEECCAIRYHMGRWNTVDSEVNELQQANRIYPLVHLIQFADQLAITNY